MGQRNPIWPTKRPSSRSKKSFRPVILGVNAAKDVIRSYLGRTGHGPGFMHFNVDRDVGYFAQLTAETIVTKELGGQKYRVWELPAGRANEASDCRVYAYAALHGMMHRGFKLNREAERVGAVMTIEHQAVVAPPAPAEHVARPEPLTPTPSALPPAKMTARRPGSVRRLA